MQDFQRVGGEGWGKSPKYNLVKRIKIIGSDPNMPLGISKQAPGDVGTLIFKGSTHRAVKNYVRFDKEVTRSGKAIIWKNAVLKSKAIQKGTCRQNWQCTLAHLQVLLSRMGGGERAWF